MECIRLKKKQRMKVYELYGGRCAYCGCGISFKQMQVDHVVPLCNGGTYEDENLLPACRSCNHRKNGESLERYRKSVEDFLKVLDRDSVTYRNAVRYGLIIPNPHPIRFYFEEFREGMDNSWKE